ncbi:TVP38/TMEM64 family protein [Sphingopyxis sp.]|uniref:TVP38/TMEM64 family protein n=1 Tax=Sphingopyxis sp. TaxID=1908224 RepID=UPI001D675603|nr:VTT domain-containing protein [Sphingopyxis sp.]MBW8295155.1 VTT domain-containing protein [Sphingopyxis sp.]
MADSPTPLRRWLTIIVLLALVVGVPLIFQEEFLLISERVLAAADKRPFAAAVLIVAALTLDAFLPVPNGVTNTLAGAAFGFAIGTFVIWLGLMGGSSAGYALGRWAARPLAARLLGADDLERAHLLAERAGPFALIVSRPVPILCELTPIAAGVAGMEFRSFLCAVALGNLGVGVVYAAIGAAAVERTSTELLMLGAIGMPLAAWLGWQAIERWRRS